MTCRVLAFLLLALPTVAQAQTPPPAPPPRVEGTVDLSFVATTGNSDTQTVGVAADTFYRPSVWEIRNKAAFVRAKTGENIRAESFVYLFRAARKFSDRLAGYGQYDYARDRFAGIGNRNALLAGVGPRCSPWRRTRSRCSAASVT